MNNLKSFIFVKVILIINTRCRYLTSRLLPKCHCGGVFLASVYENCNLVKYSDRFVAGRIRISTKIFPGSVFLNIHLVSDMKIRKILYSFFPLCGNGTNRALVRKLQVLCLFLEVPAGDIQSFEKLMIIYKFERFGSRQYVH